MIKKKKHTQLLTIAILTSAAALCICELHAIKRPEAPPSCTKQTSQEDSPTLDNLMGLQLAEALFMGDCKEKNYAHALTLYKKGLDDPSTTQKAATWAQLRIGEIYFSGGYGVEQDHAQARNYLEAVTKQNGETRARAVAQSRLADIYCTGKNGIESNPVRGYQLYEKAAITAQSDPDIQEGIIFELAQMNIIGMGCEKNYQKAYDLLLPIANQENQSHRKGFAELLIAKLLFSSEDSVPTNRLIALNYAKRAIKTYSPIEVRVEACAVLGYLYYEGVDIEPNYQHAQSFFSKIARQKYSPRFQANAQFMLGRIYMCGGHGVKVDYAAAKQHFSLAAANQNCCPAEQQEARELLGALTYLNHQTAQTARAESPQTQKQDQDCCICLSSIEKAPLTVLPCQHEHGPSIHQSCLEKLMRNDAGKTCPLCRSPMGYIEFGEEETDSTPL